MSPARAYGAWDLRQQGAATLVGSYAELLNVVTLHASQGDPCAVRLSSDIVMTGGCTLPAALAGFSLDGNGFTIRVATSVPVLFTCGAPAEFVNVTLAPVTGVTVTTVFQAPDPAANADSLILSNILTLASGGTITNLLGLFSTGAGSAGRVVADTLLFLNLANLFRDDGAGTVWDASSFRSVFNGQAGAITIGIGAGSPSIIETAFEGFNGLFTAFFTGLSTGNVLNRFLAGIGATGLTSVTSSGGNTFIAIAGSPTITLTASDTWVPRQSSRAATLNSAGPTLTVTPIDRYLRVTHGGSASGNVTVSAGVDAQELTLFFPSVAGTAVYTDGSGNLELSANLTPTANDTLSLIYDAGTSKWVETARSVN